MKLKNGWRRWTTPTTIKRRQDHFARAPLPRQTNLRVKTPEYVEPEIDLIRHEIENKARRIKIMGEAKDIVGKKQDKVIDLSKKRKDKSLEDGSVINRLAEVVEDLDHAIVVKQNDLDVEGTAQAPENHFKLGILRAADSLVRRAQAMLEDYGTDLVHDMDHSVDVDAAGGEDFETKDPWKCDHDFDGENYCKKCKLHENDIDNEDEVDE